MSGYIPEEIVEQVRLSCDIAQIIGDYVKLKRRGQNLIGLCPFHQEKTPSFTVSTQKQIYHCFGCGQGGNVYSFLMEHEKMTFPEAVRFLAAKSGITIPESHDRGDRGDLEKLYWAHDLAAERFRDLLRAPDGDRVYNGYLQNKRGLTAETIDHFGLGLSSANNHDLIELAGKKKLAPKFLVQAGLAGRGQGQGQRDGYYDRFRQRLMFPIQDLSDRIIAFGGRALKAGEPAKYLNSPETPLYSKSSTLYGLNLNREAIKQSKTVIVVEGYFDLISLWQVGVRNVVASSGTAFTQQQGRLLARFAKTAYLFFDADSAGVKAAIRSVGVLFNAGVEVKVISAPAGEDPDSIARKGPEAVAQLVEKAEGYLRFRFKDFNRTGAGLIEQHELIVELAEVARGISDEALRALFVAEAAETLAISPEVFAQSAKAPAPSARVSNDAPESARRNKTPRLSADDWGQRGEKTIEAELISLLLSHPSLTGHAAEKLNTSNFTSPRLSQLFSLMTESFAQTGGVSTSAFIDKLIEPELKSSATFLATRSWFTDTPTATLDDYIDKILVTSEKLPTIAALKQKLKEAETTGDSQQAESLTRELMERLND